MRVAPPQALLDLRDAALVRGGLLHLARHQGPHPGADALAHLQLPHAALRERRVPAVRLPARLPAMPATRRLPTTTTTTTTTTAAAAAAAALQHLGQLHLQHACGRRRLAPCVAEPRRRVRAAAPARRGPRRCVQLRRACPALEAQLQPLQAREVHHERSVALLRTRRRAA